MLLSSCTDELAATGAATAGDEVEIPFVLEVPGAVVVPTRTAAEVSLESKVAEVSVLVFDHQDKLTGYVPNAPLNQQQAKVTVKLRRSAGPSDTYRVVLLAGCDSLISQCLQNGLDLSEGVAYSAVASQLKLTLTSGRAWTLSTTQGLPMWGEVQNLLVTPGMSAPAVSLMRALARVDVGLNFSVTTNGKEKADGLTGYQLVSVTLFNRLLHGRLIPDAANLGETGGKPAATTPTLPDVAAELVPDVKQVTDTAANNMSVRSIYIPENSADGSDSNPTFLVAGISYKGGTPTYYRIDFAASNAKTRFNILRNHRYLFNIREITGLGYSTAQKAAASEAANIEWAGVDLNEDTDDEGGYISGNYYFRCATTLTVAGEAQASSTLTYDTNIPDFSASMLRWAKATEENPGGGAIFTYTVDTDQKQITFTASEATNEEKVYDFYIAPAPIAEFNIHIKRQHSVLRYKVMSAVAEGVFLPQFSQSDNSFLKGTNFELSASPLNRLKLTVRTLPTIDETKQFDFDLNTVNGYSFSDVSGNTIGQWTKTTVTEDDVEYREYTVYLQAAGVPQQAGYDNFSLTNHGYKLDSSMDIENYEAPVSVRVGYAPKKILGMSVSSLTGNQYSFVGEDGHGSGLMLRNKRNFSMSGTVPIEGMADNSNYKYDTNPTAFVADLISFKPDIAILSDAIAYISGYPVYLSPITQAQGATLVDYCLGQGEFADKGPGVLMMLLDNAASNRTNVAQSYLDYVVEPLVGGTLTAPWNTANAAGDIYPLPDAPGSASGAPHEDDLIMNGLFGPLWGTVWGKDNRNTALVTGLDTNPDIVIYSRGKRGDASTTNNVTLFRSKANNLLLVGDGGFLSQSKRIEGSATQQPFWMNRQYQPAANTTYKEPACNAFVFANAIFWAIHVTECRNIPAYIPQD
ncbi:MAG: hypothetical protein LBM06_00495 [Prevotellaceae bacterium]|jgi:hypothetical protein|nr:hypothetical protein [Prevotellaceae bacterium]